MILPLTILSGCASSQSKSVPEPNPNPVAVAAAQAGGAKPVVVHQLPKLPYAYTALEPYVDARTMEIHYDKHHRAYVKNLNDAVAGTALASKSLEEILATPELPPAVRNNAGGQYNHSLFWTVMAPHSKGGGNLKKGTLQDAIVRDFGSVDKFKEQFSKVAVTRFGSGWAWLIVTKGGKLAITGTGNQDNPLMELPGNVKGQPILALDVWEHAYYLKYQNRRPDYIKAWWNVVNWAEVQRLFDAAHVPVH